jgi:uncharacterized protein YuzE
MPAETRELSEDGSLHWGETGHVVSITMDHASLRSDLSEMKIKRINKSNNEVLEAARYQLTLIITGPWGADCFLDRRNQARTIERCRE